MIYKTQSMHTIYRALLQKFLRSIYNSFQIRFCESLVFLGKGSCSFGAVEESELFGMTFYIACRKGVEIFDGLHIG